MRPSIDAGAALGDVAAMIDRGGRLPPEVESSLLETVKTLAPSVPTPRYDPFYGIDRSGGASLGVLERLSRHGDFRKYVHVLDVRAGLGGGARWLALRYGCRVLALDERPSLVALGNRLSRRVRLGGRVVGAAGSASAVPARDGVFTQIWCVEALDACVDLRLPIGELFRVLRPGSPIALQAVVAVDAAAAPRDTAAAAPTLSAYRAAFASAGFGGIEDEDVTALRPETSTIVLSARSRFDRLLRERLPRGALPAAAEPGELTQFTLGPARDVALASGAYRVVQIFARRPST
jgi:SAM-dependent methyltransferase